MLDLQEFIITLDSIEDADSLYNDMENPSAKEFIPNRVVECVNRRPSSRNTHYLLAQNEAELIKQDPRVRDVSIYYGYLGIQAGTCEVTETSSRWNKSNTIAADHKNWGLLRCFEDQQRTNWGVGVIENQTGTITLRATGKNVDMINVDDDGFLPAHPEFAKNVDGTGGTRCVYYDWYKHDLAVKGIAQASTYTNSTLAYHPIHVQGTMAGNTQGWAKDANVYNIYYYAGDSTYSSTFPYVMNYVTEFHKSKSINPTTGHKNPTIMNNSWGMSLFSSDWTFADISAVTYRGTRYTTPVTYTGVNGVYSSSTAIASYTTATLTNFAQQIISNGSTATVTSLVFAGNGFVRSSSLTSSSTTPTVGSNDDGYWTLDLPFDITYLGVTYSQVFVGTNGYISFGGGSVSFTPSASNPPYPKIMLGSGDTSVQRIYYGIQGIDGSRNFIIRVEGSSAVAGTVGVIGMLTQYTFYENNPTVIHLTVGQNNKVTFSAFSNAELNAWGFIAGQRIPQRVSALDADLEDAIKAGVVTVGASGNGYWKHEAPGGVDWNNTFEMIARYPASVANPYYYMRGTSPTANDNRTYGTYDLPNIAVGAVGLTTVDSKANFSDCGPGTDIWAPGYNIMSAWNSSTYTTTVTDPRNSNYNLAKIDGTSMASPQVTGVLACALELNPHWNQTQAKAYITGIAKVNQLTTGSGGPTDTTDLQGAPNLFLYYKNERPALGQASPKQDNLIRPTVGQTWNITTVL